MLKPWNIVKKKSGLKSVPIDSILTFYYRAYYTTEDINCSYQCQYLIYTTAHRFQIVKI
jgi:hypothetical protein